MNISMYCKEPHFLILCQVISQYMFGLYKDGEEGYIRTGPCKCFKFNHSLPPL